MSGHIRHGGRRRKKKELLSNDKNVLQVVTARGPFSRTVDEVLMQAIERVKENIKSEKVDVG